MEIIFKNYDKILILKNIDLKIGRDIRKYARKAINEYKKECEVERDKRQEEKNKK